MQKQPAIYILTNKPYGTLYTGVTSNLAKRIQEHKAARINSFAKRYNCSLLVYAEACDDMLTAITREKQIKSGSRKNKIQLIESINPEWEDLSYLYCL